MTQANVIDRLYAAFADGDVAAARACFTADAVIWHGFDRIATTRDEAAPGWEAMISHFPERYATNVNRQPTPAGFVQQHEWHARKADGQWMAWPLCIVVEIRDGLIARLDEYIDRAGWFER